MQRAFLWLNLNSREAVQHKLKKGWWKNFENWQFWKISFFCRPFWIFFFQKNFFLLHSHVKRSKFLGSKGWFEILIITLFSSCFSPWANILHPSVYKPDFHGVSLVIFLKMGNSKIHKFSCLLKLVTSAEHKRDNLKGWELKKAQILDLL